MPRTLGFACRGIATAVAVCLASAAVAQESQPAPPPPDLCRDAVDPYNPGMERGRFFAAAGVDGEIDEGEFAKNRDAQDPFIRPFDRWDAAKPFDRNANGRLDWIEADAYRQDLRKRVLDRFDTDGDGRLGPAERLAANRALQGGELTAPAKGRRGGSGPPEDAEAPPALVRRFDRDGDGKLSEEERRLAAEALQQDHHRQRMIEPFDTDGDGELNEEERKARGEHFRQRGERMGALLEEFRLRNFDLDGDGTLNEEEAAEFTRVQKHMQETMQSVERRINDWDGDGQVTDEERRAAQERWQKAQWRIAVRMLRYMDADGDGRLTPQERLSFEDRVQDGIRKWLTDFSARYDADGDGRLLAGEHDAAMQGFREDMNRRLASADVNRDGRLEPKEVLTLIEAFAQEAGIAPTKDANAEE